MTYLRLKNVDVRIPIYESSALRLIRMPSFRLARVGSRDVGNTSGILVVHAVRDLSIEIQEGDRVGLIGHNGAGKTTLLRVLAGIYPCSGGTLERRGSVRSILASNMALNPDATGYENIRLVAKLNDWRRDMLDAHIRDVEEFTELGEYLSLPLRIYSAGMAARLSFALATIQAPDILLLDEGIGAGDAQFQEKAQKRVNDFLDRAKIIVAASHSAALLKSICNKGMLLNQGQLVHYGDLSEALRIYGDQAHAVAVNQ